MPTKKNDLNEKYELIIAEKPSSAKKIAEALSTSKTITHKDSGVIDYFIDHNGKKIVVANAVGHLFGLTQTDKTDKSYPIFDIEWKPSYEVNKGSSFTKKYLTRLKKLAKNAQSFTIATDYDIEGEVIGWNIIRFACKQKDANRMKFSTTTKSDLLKAYDNKLKTLDWGQAFAGETRHKLDWFYGINISRALTQSLMDQGRFKVMSTGRIQGPLLKLLVDKEKSIQSFKPETYYELRIKFLKDLKEFEALHVEERFFDKNKFEKIKNKIKDFKETIVKSIETKKFKQEAPLPFDLTSLQIESFRCFKISPKETLSLAQDLYSDSYISYPRTSSNQLPKEIEYKKIFSDLQKNPTYSEKVKTLLSIKKDLIPNNGKKTDPAHPAIYPTGEIPKKLDKEHKNIYDLIVKRFIATFGEPATRQSVKISLDVSDEIFTLKGTTTKEKGWHIFYDPYLNLKEEELPAFVENEKLELLDILDEEKQTQPPKRYNPASIIKELEKRNLGTKATRASIVDTLFQRGYIAGKPIEVTEVGMKTENILERFCPEILDEELTKNFEIEMDEIRANTKKPEKVLEEAKEILRKTLSHFNKKKNNVGEALVEADNIQKEVESYYGPCPKCKEGNLALKDGKFGKFLACNKYPDCKLTLSLPKNALVKFAEKQCEHCTFPMVKLIKKGKKPEELCINPDCPSKKEQNDELKQFEGKPCPKCETGKLIIRKGAYGSFVACASYPKCKYIHNTNGFKKDKSE
jgi:DNA topoisomerase I